MNHPRLKPKDSGLFTVLKKPPVCKNNCEPLLINSNRNRLLTATFANTAE